MLRDFCQQKSEQISIFSYQQFLHQEVGAGFAQGSEKDLLVEI
jgi:hypothetical protein